jgi:multidrug efflux pump subunit AcrA (membrane-fusion protein)
MNMRRILWGVVILLVLLAAYRIIVKVTAKKVQAERVFPVVIQMLRIGELQYKVTLTGDVKADTEVNVRPRVAGRVEQIYADEGDYVDKDQELLSFVSGISTESEIYEDMIVRAPIAGIVGMKMVREGEQVGGSPGSLNPVFTLYSIDNVKIYADVSEKDYSLLAKGTPAEITLDAFPGETFHGRVSNIRPVIDPLTRTTQVEIVLPNPRHRIKPGMFAKVDLILQRATNVPIIPFDAVLGESDKYVFVSQNDLAVKKLITLGLQQDDNVEVRSGLTTADKVIVLGERVLTEGAKIMETTGQ